MRRIQSTARPEVVVFRVTAPNGCTVFYELNADALVVTPAGSSFRARVDYEVELVIVPPFLDMKRIRQRFLRELRNAESANI